MDEKISITRQDRAYNTLQLQTMRMSPGQLIPEVFALLVLI